MGYRTTRVNLAITTPGLGPVCRTVHPRLGSVIQGDWAGPLGNDNRGRRLREGEQEIQEEEREQQQWQQRLEEEKRQEDQEEKDGERFHNVRKHRIGLGSRVIRSTTITTTTGTTGTTGTIGSSHQPSTTTRTTLSSTTSTTRAPPYLQAPVLYLPWALGGRRRWPDEGR